MTTLAISGDIKLGAQTYYNPTDEINITLTIKEPYTPINYYEIGQNFNNILQEEAARREALKKYYDQIYFDTKISVTANTYFTDENTINQKILLLQDATLDNLDRQNKSLKMGMLKPEYYEQNLRTCYYNYIKNNQVFLNLCRYKYLKSVEYKTDSLRGVFNSDFSIALASISKFNVDAYNTEFVVVGLADSITAPEKKSIGQLFMFICTVSEGNLKQYQINWQEKNLIQQKKAKSVKDFNDQWIKMVSKIMDSRDAKLLALSEKEKVKYLKNERKYLDKMLGGYFMNYNFGKGRRFLNSIERNGRRFINMTEYAVEKINQNSSVNLFYKYISEFCNCGVYDPSLFN